MTENKKVDPGNSSEEIQRELLRGMKESPESAELLLQFAHIEMMGLHARALVCHCECLAFNSANSSAVCAGISVPYGDEAYTSTMEKWGIMDKDGKPLI